MISNDERPERRDDKGEVPFSTLDTNDHLVRAFREFLISESSRRDPDHVWQIVADFSRRVTFLTQHMGLNLQSDSVVDMIAGLNDAKMAEMALDAVDSDEGRDRLKDVLQTRPYPHYEADPNNGELLVRIESDGTRTTGQFVNQEFVAVNNG